jgi:branched-chain amino acid transport system substrate-binding protein
VIPTGILKMGDGKNNPREVFRMKTKLLTTVVVLLCLAVSLPLACPTSTSEAPTEILIGGVCSLTGMFAGFGEGSQWGLQAAIDDINAEGGVYVKEYDKKLPLRLIVVNSESDPVKTGALAEDLVLNDKVNFLTVGGEPPTTTAGVSNTADKYQVIFVSCCGPYEPWKALRDAAPNHWKYTWACGTFAIATPAPPGDFRAVPGYTIVDAWKSQLDMFGDQTNKKAAVFASDDPDGIGWYGLFPGVLQDMGYEVAGADKQLGLLPVETTDFSSTINEWKNNNCEIIWGNAPAPFIATMWKQCATLGFRPKIATLGRGSLFLEDVASWGGNLPNGVGTEIYWHPAWEDSPGFGDTTPSSLDDRWHTATGRGVNSAVADGYRSIQTIVDAVERAGTLDTDAVWTALSETDLMTVAHRVKFDDTQFNRGGLVYGQWQKSNTPAGWSLEVVYSDLPFVKPTAEPIFPIPYD